jgi:hypothetical protein
MLLALLAARTLCRWEEIPVGKYRIQSSTLALIEENGRRTSCTLPAGTVIATDHLEAQGLVEVVWENKKFLMFAKDLRSRAEPVET